MMQTPPKVIYLVIIALSGLAFIGLCSLCLTLFYKNYADPAVLTAIISTTSSVIGSLGTILVSTRSQQPNADVQTTITTTTRPKPQQPSVPAEVVVTNTPENPVQTEEAK